MIKRLIQFVFAMFLPFVVNVSVLASDNCRFIQKPTGTFTKTDTTAQGGNTPARLRYYTLKCLEELSGESSFTNELEATLPDAACTISNSCIDY